MRSIVLVATVVAAIQAVLTLSPKPNTNLNRPTPTEAIAVLLADRPLLLSDRTGRTTPPPDGPQVFVLPGDPKDGPYGAFPPVPTPRPLNCCYFYSTNTRTGRSVVK